MDHGTVWLTQAQLAALFDRERSVISKHLRTIFQTGELDEESNVQKMRIAFSDKPVSYYNLDVIISVGYRVNSIKGTQFRRWVTNILRQYLVQGYALNEKRLRESARQLNGLKRLVQLQGEVAANQELTPDQSNALLRVLGDYARALDVLGQYDHQRLQVRGTATNELFELTYEAGLEAGTACVSSLAAVPCLAAKKMLRSRAQYAQFTRALMGRTCTRAWRKKRPIYSISLSKTIRFWMVISALRRSYSSGFSTATIACTTPTARAGWPIMH